MNQMIELFFCVLIIGNILETKCFVEQNHTTKKKLNACQRCKVLTDSFQYWLDKTSRGKYEGGDAAWEVEKLKSYSRSEIRLTEVQEGLCSELQKHKNDCYMLAEETESLIEMWWFLENTTDTDLFKWLCIGNLQYCCPNGHFGAMCDPCPQGKNKVCSGHGKCIGDGTRNGNGTCLCQHGYTGNVCDDCAHNFYERNSECMPCHKACEECIGSGPNNCKACKSGWHLDHDVCVDVDECLDSFICQHNEYCSNIVGTYTCNECHTSCKTCKGNGSVNCTACLDNSTLWGGTCINDELKSNILHSYLKRLGLYSGLLIIAYFILHSYRKLSILIVAIIAVYVYYSEKSYDINIVSVF